MRIRSIYPAPVSYTHLDVYKRQIAVNGQPAGHVSSYVGDVGLEVTYWLGREYWGRGIASAALQAFLLVQTHRPLRGRAAADNAASLRVLERCGFARVGQARGFANARQAEIDEILLELCLLYTSKYSEVCNSTTKLLQA